jgi:hypothetical protein
MTAQLLRSFLIPASVLVCSIAGAQQSPDPSVDQAVPLSSDELQQITVGLLQHYPELGGSPGVKVAGAYLGGPSGRDAASVLYFPHSEQRGIKEAFQAHCRRTPPSTNWVCNDVEIRRYLQVASQEFEVRVLAGISSEAAFALIDAARRDLTAAPTDASTAIIITAQHNEPGRYFIGFGTPEGALKLTMLAQLTHGGNPRNPDDWHASIFEPRSPE